LRLLVRWLINAGAILLVAWIVDGIEVRGPVAALLAAAEEAAASFGLAGHLAPLLGHGIGLETVEEPLLMPGVDDRLEAGMVLCIEPALRVPGLGGYSIEEMVVVEAAGPRILTRTPRRPHAGGSPGAAAAGS